MTSMEDLVPERTPQSILRSLNSVRSLVPTAVDFGLVLAIDPGTEKSGWCLFDGVDVRDSGVADNRDVLRWVRESRAQTLAIEMVASYGMPVGRETFETVRWIGRFQQAWTLPEEVELVYRKDVKLYLCGSLKARDANIRQAILDRFPRTGGGKTPQVGTKRQPGPLYGVSTHAWSALAVAITAHHQILNPEAS